MRRLVAVLLVFVVTTACTGNDGVSGPSVTSATTLSSVSASSTSSVVASSSTTSVPTVVTTSTIPLLPDLRSLRVSHDEEIFGNAVMNSVIASGPGFVAVGGSLDDESRNNALVWRSSDGLTWSRVSPTQPVFRDVTLRSITAHGDGMVVVGTDDSDARIDAAVWRSNDGLAWVRVPHDDSVFGGSGPQIMQSVTSFDGGLVAVGESGTDFGPDKAAVWVSPDGNGWTRVTPQASVFEDSIMTDVTTFGNLLVAVGFAVSDSGVDAAVWSSTRGTDWTRVAHDDSIFGGEGDQIMVSVASSNGILVAVGFDQPGMGDAAVWTSTDASTWKRLPHDEAVLGAGEAGGAEMTSVEAYGQGFIAGGSQQISGDVDAVVWTSANGLVWGRVTSEEPVFGGEDQQRIAALSVLDETIIGVGLQAPYGVNLDTNPDGVVWILAP